MEIKCMFEYLGVVHKVDSSRKLEKRFIAQRKIKCHGIEVDEEFLSVRRRKSIQKRALELYFGSNDIKWD